MDDALHEHFDSIAQWTRPDGGYFFWMRLDESVDTAPLREKARELETGFQAGAVFQVMGNSAIIFGSVSRITMKTIFARALPGCGLFLTRIATAMATIVRE